MQDPKRVMKDGREQADPPIPAKSEPAGADHKDFAATYNWPSVHCLISTRISEASFPRRHYVYVYRGMMHDRFRLGLLRSETMPARYPVTILLAMGIAVAPAFGQTFVAPSNRVALSFGMTPQEASQTLGVPLYCVRCSRGSELLLAIPNVKGAALSFRSDGLYLQFRKGRLTGWKGDWGTIRP
jgi:hypothetical protein